jgi:hypothetical protein
MGPGADRIGSAMQPEGRDPGADGSRTMEPADRQPEGRSGGNRDGKRERASKPVGSRWRGFPNFGGWKPPLLELTGSAFRTGF